MKKQYTTTLSVIAVAFLLITGCGKDNAPAPPAPTKTQLITQGSWKFDHAMANGTDISSSVNACFKDNIATFNNAGNMTLDESTTVCSPSYGGSYTWAFQTSETVLHLSAPIFTGGSSDFTIVSLNATNMVLSQTMTIAPYPPTPVAVTFKH
jgi:lipocalin-like protein